MANTYNVTLNKDAWTVVASAGSGFFTNEGTSPIKIRVSTSLPDPSDNTGHSLGYSGLSPLNIIGYTLAAGEVFYARCYHSQTSLATVTPDA